MSDDPIKSYLLLSKKTGNVMEGFRVNFVDAKRWDNETPSPKGYKVVLMIDNEFDGWIVRNPEADSGMGGFSIFLPRDWADEELENLGEI